MLKNLENNGTEEIGLVIPTPGRLKLQKYSKEHNVNLAAVTSHQVFNQKCTSLYINAL